MDCFCIIVLERTLETLMEVLPAEENPGTAANVDRVRRAVKSMANDWDPACLIKLEELLRELVTIAHRERQFYIAARLRAVLQEFAQHYEKAS